MASYETFLSLFAAEILQIGKSALARALPPTDDRRIERL